MVSSKMAHEITINLWTFHWRSVGLQYKNVARYNEQMINK